MVAPWLGKPICHGNGQHTVIGKLTAFLEYLNWLESCASEFISGTYHITVNGSVYCIILFLHFPLGISLLNTFTFKMICFKEYVLEIGTEVIKEQTLVASVSHDKSLGSRRIDRYHKI